MCKSLDLTNNARRQTYRHTPVSNCLGMYSTLLSMPDADMEQPTDVIPGGLDAEARLESVKVYCGRCTGLGDGAAGAGGDT